MASPSVEDYLKAIYSTQQDGDATTQTLASRLGVSAPAVSKMLKKLAELRLVTHSPYHDCELTPAGEKMALEIIRHHRLLERYLVEALGYGWDEVHTEAERLEHHISEEFEARIDALLGFPATCPHGEPIPTRDGTVAAQEGHALSEQSLPGLLTIRRVRDEDSALLRYFKELGLLPGTAIEFVSQEPFGGAFLVRIGSELVRVAPQAAQSLFVAATDQEEARASLSAPRREAEAQA